MSTLDQYLNYFYAIARELKAIGHTDEKPKAFRIDVNDLSSSVRSNVSWPLMAIETPVLAAMGNQFANPRWIWESGVMILDKAAKDNPTEATEAQNRTLAVVSDIASRLIRDRKDYDQQKKAYALQGLSLQSMGIEPVPNYFGDFTGHRLSFQWNEPMDRFDPAKWTNVENAKP